MAGPVFDELSRPYNPIPGPRGLQGDPGVKGDQGNAGVNAFSLTTLAFTQPADLASVSVQVSSTAWMAVGQSVFVETAGYFLVSSVTNATTVVLQKQAIAGFAAPGATIASGKKSSPAGFAYVDNSQYTALAARVTALEGSPGFQTYIQGTAPTGSITTGSLWFDSAHNYDMYRWNGTAWVLVPFVVSVGDFGTGLTVPKLGSVLPGTATLGDLFFLTTDKKLYRYNGTAWVATISGSDITGTIDGSQLAANSIVAGAIAAGAILATHVGTNQIIAYTANIADGIITDAKIQTLAASKIVAGIISGQVIQIDGAGGALQSSNFIAGSQGFRVKGDGTSEFNSVTIRGTLEAASVRTDSKFFNSGDTSRLMPGVSMVTDDVIAANGGTVNISGVSTYPTFSYYTSASLILGGWGIGAAGYSLSRVGQTNFRAIVTLAGNCAPTTAGQLVYGPVWRTRTNGGAWGAWNGPGADNYADSGTVARNLQYTYPVNLTIGAGDEVQFGLRVARNSGSTGGTIGLAQITAVAFNV